MSCISDDSLDMARHRISTATYHLLRDNSRGVPTCQTFTCPYDSSAVSGGSRETRWMTSRSSAQLRQGTMSSPKKKTTSRLSRRTSRVSCIKNSRVSHLPPTHQLHNGSLHHSSRSHPGPVPLPAAPAASLTPASLAPRQRRKRQRGYPLCPFLRQHSHCSP